MNQKLKMPDRHSATSDRYKSYPSLHSLGVENIGPIPESWDVRRLKYAANIDPESLSSDTPSDFEFYYVDIDSVDSTGKIRFTNDPTTFDEAPTRARRVVENGDVLFSTVRPYLRAIAQYQGTPSPCIASTGFAVLRSRENIDSRYLWRYVQSEPFVQESVSRATGIGYPAVGSAELARIPVLVPPERDQEAIVGFLDCHTRKIDRLIDKKERLIELLEERRTALITKAVTKGLDPDVPMKDSGVEWLGKIPRHWDTVKVKYLADYINGYAFSSSDWGDSGKKIIRIQNLTGSEEEYNYFDGTLPEKHLAQPGDILIAWSASLGAFRWEESESGWVNQHIYKAIPHETLVQKDFFLWLAKVFMAELEREMHGSAMQHVTQQKFGSLKVPLPPVDEQDLIARRISEKEADLRTVEDRVNQAIQMLEEYRSALITAAVTGKIDVREQAA